MIRPARALGVCAALYVAALAGANLGGANAQGVPEALPEALLVGDMAKLTLPDAPAPAFEGEVAEVLTPEGAPVSPADWAGEVAVVNFWATWCAPCREEMPALAALAADPPPGVRVLAVATGRNDPAAVEAFLAEAGAGAVEDLRDPEGRLGRALAVLGLPTTVILGPDGREAARLVGIADWNGAEARALLAALAADAGSAPPAPPAAPPSAPPPGEAFTDP